MICLFQLSEINVLTWNVLNGRIRRFAQRQGVARIGNHPPSDGHDNVRRIALDGDRMIWIWNLNLLLFDVLFSFRLLDSGIHSAIHGKIRSSDVGRLRTGDKRHHCSDLINVAVAVECCSRLLRLRPLARGRI